MKKKLIIIVILGGILIVSLSFFFVALKLTGSVVDNENKTDFGIASVNDSDKDKEKEKLSEDCFKLDSGKLACKIASDVKINSGKITEDDFKIKNK